MFIFGDGATEEGAFSESLDFAALFELPVLFVCENNFYSVYTNLMARQAVGRNLQKVCAGHTIQSFVGDGNDVVNVYETANLAINYIKSEKKPALIEFETYRWLEHCGPYYDDHLGYSEKNELSNWKKKCPIERIIKTLYSEGYSENDIVQHKNSVLEEIEKAFAYARKSSFPGFNDLFSNVYAN